MTLKQAIKAVRKAIEKDTKQPWKLSPYGPGPDSIVQVERESGEA